MSSYQQFQGLTAEQVAESRRLNGSNILTPPKRESLWKKFLHKFSDPLIIILLIAGALSILISCYEYWGIGKDASVFFEPIGIFIAIILATGLAFIFEMKADKEFSILNKVNDDEAVRVLRDEAVTEIPRRDVVVGDIVFLNTGDEVPADGVLLESVNLTIDESTLTGEPACHKTTDETHFDEEATYPSNTVLRGTKVMEGHGTFRVDKVGDATENGRVFVESQIDNSVKTPLNEQLDRLGRFISVASYAIGALIIAGRCLMYYLDPSFTSFWSIDFGSYFLQSLMIAVTLVVVAVPEGLPMAVTLSLAYSMRRMLKTNNLVRKLHACETMGATTVICTDKTGTLTRNQMTVAQADFYGDVPDAVIEESIAVNSTAMLNLSGEKPGVIGNPTEGALLLWLNSKGVDYEAIRRDAPKIAELPFTTERKYMASIVTSAATGKPTLYVKGAPEIVLGLCAQIAGGKSRGEINESLTKLQNQAMRTLGFAVCQLDSADNIITPDGLNVPSDLTFIGVTAISDPVRDDVPDAVKECTDAGIEVKIVTGDTPATAREIGRRISLIDDTDSPDCIITGPEFAALTDKQLLDRADSLKIIARARPTDKKRLVEALQTRGHVVAVTGDGTNDAPALKAAHVGLSMGDGTSVAKEASDITIVDNSFASIGRAVMWGRSLYRNIQRFILFQLTVNVAACLIVLVGSFMGTESPLTVTQMLWVNLIMDTFAAMALASLPPSREVMADKPRNRKDFIISRAMRGDIISVGLIFFVILFAILYLFTHADIRTLTDILHPRFCAHHNLSPYELSLFFTIFVFLQFWNMFNARAFMTNHSGLRLKGCGEFEMIAIVIFVGQILIVELGGEFFNVTPLRFSDWCIIVVATSFVLWIGEAIRLFHKHSHNQ